MVGNSVEIITCDVVQAGLRRGHQVRMLMVLAARGDAALVRRTDAAAAAAAAHRAGRAQHGRTGRHWVVQVVQVVWRCRLRGRCRRRVDLEACVCGVVGCLCVSVFGGGRTYGTNSE